MTESDAELLKASRRGDPEAFRGLFERYFRRILAVATGMLGNREDAQDVSQETFIRAYRSLRAFKGESAFYTWLYRIAVNLCIDARRREIRSRRAGVEKDADRTTHQEASEIPDDHPRADPFDHVRVKDLQMQIRSALDELTPEQRAVIVLREVEGLSYEEISEVMQCAKGTVMSRLHYARERLKGSLQ